MTKQIDEFTDVFSFLFWQLGVRETSLVGGRSRFTAEGRRHGGKITSVLPTLPQNARKDGAPAFILFLSQAQKRGPSALFSPRRHGGDWLSEFVEPTLSQNARKDGAPRSLFLSLFGSLNPEGAPSLRQAQGRLLSLGALERQGF